MAWQRRTEAAHAGKTDDQATEEAASPVSPTRRTGTTSAPKTTEAEARLRSPGEAEGGSRSQKRRDGHSGSATSPAKTVAVSREVCTHLLSYFEDPIFREGVVPLPVR